MGYLCKSYMFIPLKSFNGYEFTILSHLCKAVRGIKEVLGDIHMNIETGNFYEW